MSMTQKLFRPDMKNGKCCPTCKGTGKVLLTAPAESQTITGMEEVVCFACNGDGLCPPNPR